ncbi:MAG: glucose-6-phosphate isomerase family protein [Archaeoglobaceae archaeon]
MEFEIRGKKFAAEVRKASDLKPVLAFPEALKEDFDAYYMIRDVWFSEEERRRIEAANLRYDYTIIPPAEIGGERIKTFGHYHPEAELGLSYPEVYQVLSGRAIYLLQREENGRVVDVVVVEARKGDIVVIPPNYGHVTINPDDVELRMSNWVCRSFKSIYEPFAARRGACYYFVSGEWIKNERYVEVPEPRFAEPNGDFDVGEMFELVERIEELEFLVKPSKKKIVL